MTRRPWIGPAIALATFTLACGIPELVTRLVDPPLREYRAMFSAAIATRRVCS